MAADQGTATTITFGTSGFTADLLSVNGGAVTRDAIETTHMGTTTGKTFVPADIEDGGEYTMEIAFLGNLTLPTMGTAVAEAVTIDWGGTGTGYKWGFSGFVTSTGDISASINERMTTTLTIKVSGDITIS